MYRTNILCIVCDQLARLRSRDCSDRCAVLLSLLSDAERLTSYVNSLLHVDERQWTLASYSPSDNDEPITSEIYHRACLLHMNYSCNIKIDRKQHKLESSQ